MRSDDAYAGSGRGSRRTAGGADLRLGRATGVGELERWTWQSARVESGPLCFEVTAGGTGDRRSDNRDSANPPPSDPAQSTGSDHAGERWPAAAVGCAPSSGGPDSRRAVAVINLYDVVWAAGIALAALVYLALVALGAWWLGTRSDD